MIFDNEIIMDDMKDVYTQNIKWEMLKNKKVFISGSYGMLASYMVFFLSFLNIFYEFNIIIYAQGRDENKAKERFKDLLSYDWFHFIDDDICQGFKQFYRVDYIVHAAGISRPNMYMTNPVQVIEPNVIGTYNLLELARKSKAQGFLLFSTGDIYGVVDNPNNITENVIGKMDPLDMHSCYGESKRLAETLCKAYYQQYGVRTIMARIGHTYGPTMDVKNDPRVFASFLQCVLNSEDIKILSAGTSKRPFCYLADATAAYLLLLIEGLGGEAYNVCNSSEFLSINEFAQILVKLGQDKGIKAKHMKRDVHDLYLECNANQCNCISEEKLIKLGWKPHYNTEQGMRRCLQYFEGGKI